jgi:hypothetical protein
VAVPIAACVATWLAQVEPAQSAPRGAISDATAVVVGATTQDVSGVFQTTLELASASCRLARCPDRSHARVWGGTLGGIRQQVGELPAPRVGDRVDVAFAADARASFLDFPGPSAIVLRAATGLTK